MAAEANGATGAALREYIWLDDLPVAMVDDTGPSPVIYYIHTDHLGTPQKLRRFIVALPVTEFALPKGIELAVPHNVHGAVGRLPPADCLPGRLTNVREGFGAA